MRVSTNRIIHATLVACFASAAALAHGEAAQTRPMQIDVATVKKSFDPAATQRFLAAAQDGNIAKVAYELANGADPDANHGEALISASLRGDSDLVKTLLDAGHANPNAGEGRALVLAALNGHDDIVNDLINHGMDPNGVDHKGWPLAVAAMHNNISTVKVLLKRGADININNGWALANAIVFGAKEGVDALLSLNADIDAGGGLPLASALSAGNVAAAEKLLSLNANPTLYTVKSNVNDLIKSGQATAAQKQIIDLINKKIALIKEPSPAYKPS